MFDTARALVRASLPPAGESPSRADVKVALLRRIYGRDLDARTIARIEDRLARQG